LPPARHDVQVGPAEAFLEAAADIVHAAVPDFFGGIQAGGDHGIG
jgi:hypothetical protein